MPTLSNIQEFKGNGKKFFYLRVNGIVYSFPLPTIEYELKELNSSGLVIGVTENSKNELKKMKGLTPQYPDVLSGLGNRIAFLPFENRILNDNGRVFYHEASFIDPRLNCSISSDEIKNSLSDLTSSGKIIREFYIHFKDLSGYRPGDYKSPIYTIMLYNWHKTIGSQEPIKVNDIYYNPQKYGCCYGTLPNPRATEQIITLNGEKIEYVLEESLLRIGNESQNWITYDFNGNFRVNSDFCYLDVEQQQ